MDDLKLNVMTGRGDMTASQTTHCGWRDCLRTEEFYLGATDMATTVGRITITASKGMFVPLRPKRTWECHAKNTQFEFRASLIVTSWHLTDE